MKMTYATIAESNQIYKRKILEVNDEIIDALLKNDLNRIKRLREVLSFMLEKYIKAN
jgi:uncharacterized protein YjgD (DUF1641 family)